MSIIIPFRVTSDRIHDVELHDGTTVGQFVKYLKQWGYDVADARVIVRRHAQKDALVGQLDSYVLKNLDAVEFATDIVDMPVANRLELQRMKQAACTCCKEVGVKKPSTGVKVIINGKVVYEG